MHPKQHAKNKGQVLVIVSLMLIGLVAILALVLDGGMLFSNRRTAQLAADAGALAGARAYCFSEKKAPGHAVNAAKITATDYVELNNADLVNVTVEAGGDVVVDTSITYDTFFLGILGRPQLTATASATAGCAPPADAIGVLPIAWSCRPPSGESDSGDCELKLPDNDECIPGFDPMYIIADDIPIEGEVVCGDPEAEPPPGEIVTYVDCDIDGNGEDDLDLLSGGNRSWLNMDGDSGNADELMEWIEDGYYESISIHTWFGGTEGAVNKIYQDIDTYLLNAKVIVPVFDQICDVLPSDEDDNPCKDLWHEEDQVVPSNTYKDYFHVISFALFKITCVDYGGQSNCPLHEHVAEDLPPQGQQFFSVEGCFLDNFDPGLGGGGGEVDTGPFIVYLKH